MKKRIGIYFINRPMILRTGNVYIHKRLTLCMALLYLVNIKKKSVQILSSYEVV